jgi:hypothetical protein
MNNNKSVGIIKSVMYSAASGSKTLVIMRNMSGDYTSTSSC